MFNFNIKKEFLVYLQKLKKENDLKIVDTHVHPFDVMGAAHYYDYREEYSGELYLKENLENKKIDYRKPGLSEMLKFNKTATILSKNAFKFFPKTVNHEIKKLYSKTSEKRALEEMEKSLVDEAVFLPVEPWINTEWSGKYYSNKKFLLLGSFDVHRIDKNKIEERVKYYIEKYKIVGIKLHPNLQGFKPLPKDNPQEIAERLKVIYKMAEKYSLYLLFHGGTSFYTNFPDKKYQNFKRANNNALLENFCDENGKSEIFDLNIPVVIAHLGHFGLNKINYKLAKKIIENNNNIYFDTAGVSPKLIKNFIELIGSKKIILGSDAFYNKMIFAIYFVFEAAKKAKTNEKVNDIMINILGRNYYSRILRRR